MQIVFHIGAHGTDGDRMLKTLLKNRDRLVQRQVEIIPPQRHRTVIDDTLRALAGGKATPAMEEMLLDTLLETENPERVILSTQSLMGAPGRVCGRAGFYHQIGPRCAALTGLLPSAQSEFFLAIRNPATLLVEVMQQFTGGDYGELMQGLSPMNLRWRDVIRRMVAAAQGRRVVVWCHEDVPLIWPELVRLMANLPGDVPLGGTLVYMQDLLTNAGLDALQDSLTGRDQLSIPQRRRLFSTLLAEHARPEVVDQIVDLPGWTQELVDQVTAQYQADVAEIAVLPGVEFVMP
ncbi:hypothetical protein [Paracoccus sp. (in: a-proteobacteria)]|uniref:hypothetical protein n=1 Tax=Paracoccus sp. TaxID=267 RepID=UPI0026DED3C3|nr:hypothetical protein [Paracoccus sp. (in: a-proteobacteria)]MDO5648202.1 hypothetical protein [Paracoccus sp. (in: a-proteobacteria)]